MTIHRTWHTIININNGRNFNSLFGVCLIFSTYDSANLSIGNNTMKKMLLATALYNLCRICSWRCCSNKPATVAQRKPSPIISSFLEIGQKKTVDATKICGAENVVKTETDIRKWIAPVYYFGVMLRWKRVCIAHNNCMSCPSWATLSALLINILRVPSSCFCTSDQPLSEGEIIPFSGVCQSGEAALSTPGDGSFTHWLTDCFDVQPTW